VDGTLIILVLLVLMYVVLFLPRQRQAARQRDMQASLASGDEVVTIGGVRGTVRDIADEHVVIEVSPGVEVRFVREAVARRLGTASDDLQDTAPPAGVGDGDGATGPTAPEGVDDEDGAPS